ncbi:MAG: outer membrane protein assembly factor [Spirosomaceae bacterium]|nr:outer membrane protein assembly factor [Spirosomataceae bacterium]
MRKYIYTTSLVLFGLIAGQAQNYFGASQEEFGTNRIQNKRFTWSTIKSNNFEFNFYRGGEKLTQDAAKIAEAEYDRITELLGYTPFTTMKIFVYNTPKDLEQSNIGTASPIELDGGILNLAKSRVQVAYKGNDENFKKEIVEQIAKLFVYDMLYGGSLKEVLQSSLLLSVPEWYMAGIASYIAEKNDDPAVLDKLKTAVLKNQNRKISGLQGEEARLVGHSIWFYIAQRYGKDNISNILNLTRIIRTEESSITSTLGISYGRFIREWKEYYANGSFNGTAQETKTEPQNSVEETPKQVETPVKIEKLDLQPGEVDTDNYEFDSENVIKSLADETAKSRGETPEKQFQRTNRFKEELKIKGPVAYQNMMLANDLKTEFLVDPVRKMGVKVTMMMNDLLENHIIKMGLFVTPNLRNHDITLQYENREKKIDYGFRYDRRGVSFEEIDSRSAYLFRPYGVNITRSNNLRLFRRLHSNKFTFTASYPFSNKLRLSASPFLFSSSDIDVGNLQRESVHSTFLGHKLELVYDNTKLLNGKTMIGTRAKIRSERYYDLNPKPLPEGFNRLTFDGRHYQNILNTFVLAGRVNYGRALSRRTQNDQYVPRAILGGAENWVNRSSIELNNENVLVPRDLRGLLMYDFPGNLRGFDFGKLYGTSYLLTNVELRMPFSQYFSKSSLTSSFLRNLQFVGFYDIGTAWMGRNGPFSRQNSLNTEVVGGGDNPFRATVTNFKNPFLMGYGVGARTTILGYFVKFDYAWGIEDKEIGKPRMYLSLGQDF